MSNHNQRPHPRVLGAIRGANSKLQHIVVPVLKKDNITVGRSRTSNITISSTNISKQHCRIYTRRTSNGYLVCVEDLSESGTFLNGFRIGKYQHRVLYPGCILNFADPSITFYFMRIGESYGNWLNPTLMTLPDGKQVMISNELVGEGTQSEVYLVGTPHSQQQLVCKRTRSDNLYATQLDYHKKRLENEVEILKKLHHPNIISIVHAQQNQDNTYSIISPLICGSTLQSIIKNTAKEPLQEITIRFIMHQLFSALKHIHANHIIHKDLKPDNIFIHANRACLPHVVIGDFGLSIDTTKETFSASDHGTKAYFAPELVMNEMVETAFDHKVDCWSLGMIMYQLYATNFPFTQLDTDNDDEWVYIRQWILNGELDFTTLPVWSTVGPDTIPLLNNLLNKDPTRRYSSQQAFNTRYIQLDFSRYGLLEQYTRVMDPRHPTLSPPSPSVSISSPSPSSTIATTTITTTRKRRAFSGFKSIEIRTPIPIPGNRQQQQSFNHGINHGPRPGKLENGLNII
ncbi:kinase-like domain-containing protein [Chlamydoabsidia padenii]|nr:kinase-like domain-containing protein [Chlamydoabsidia padenii]